MYVYVCGGAQFCHPYGVICTFFSAPHATDYVDINGANQPADGLSVELGGPKETRLTRLLQITPDYTCLTRVCMCVCMCMWVCGLSFATPMV